MKNCVFSSPGMIAEDSRDNSTITTNKRLNTEGTQQITTFPTKSTDSLKKLFQHRCCHGNFTTWNETIMQSPCSLRKTQPAGKHLIRTAEPTLLLLFCFKFGGEKKRSVIHSNSPRLRQILAHVSHRYCEPPAVTRS